MLQGLPAFEKVDVRNEKRLQFIKRDVGNKLDICGLRDNSIFRWRGIPVLQEA